MDVGRDGLHPARPFGRVDGDVAGTVARSLPPALVDVDVLITGVLEAARHHGVRLRLDDVVVDLGGEAVPGRPPHRRPRSRWRRPPRPRHRARATGRAAVARAAARHRRLLRPCRRPPRPPPPDPLADHRRHRRVPPAARRRPAAGAAAGSAGRPAAGPGPSPPCRRAGGPAVEPPSVPPEPVELNPAPPTRPTRQRPPVTAVPPVHVDEPPLPPGPVPDDSPPAAAETAGDQERDGSGGYESRASRQGARGNVRISDTPDEGRMVPFDGV